MNRKIFIYGFLAILISGSVLLLVDEPLSDGAKAWLVADSLTGVDLEVNELYRKFAATPAFKPSRGPLNTEQRTTSRLCSRLTVNCLAIIQAAPARVEPLIPNNPEYWAAYHAAVQAGVPRRDPELELSESVFSGGQEVIRASNLMYLRDMLDHGTINIGTMLDNLELSRRLMRESESMISKMIFVASFGIQLAAVKTVLSIDSTEANILANDPRLDDLLNPLTLTELSFRKALRTEFRLGYQNTKYKSRSDLFREMGILKVNSLTNKWYLFSSQLAGNSELEWKSFWESPAIYYQNTILQRIFDPLGTKLIEPISGVYNQYALVGQMNQAFLATARLHQEIAKGKSPDEISFPTMELWRWEMDAQETETCLVPVNIHSEHDISEYAFCVSLALSPKIKLTPDNIDNYIENEVCREKLKYMPKMSDAESLNVCSYVSD